MIDCMTSDAHYRQLAREAGHNGKEEDSLKKVGFTDQAVEKILLENDVLGKPKLLDGGSNEVFLVLLKSGNAGIFKPGAGEQRLWEQSYEPEFMPSKGKLFQRERAAYVVSQALGLDIVPTTVIREIHGKTGSFQQFIPGCENWNQWWWEDGKARRSFSSEQLFLMSIFDYIIWNKDRKSANLLKRGKEMYAIDHGLSFDPWQDSGSRESHLESFVYDEEPPEKFINGLYDFMTNQEAQAGIWKELEEIIPIEAIKAMLARMKLLELQLKKHGKIKGINRMDYYPGKS